MRCLDADASKAMVAEIDQAHKDGDTLGGVVEVLAYGVPVGLGSHVHWDRRLDARLAAALMGIQAIKGVEVGDGFELARVPGSKAHDEIVPTDEGIRRTSGRSGGTEGGLTTGELLRVRAAMKPIATVPRALATVDVATGEAAAAHHQRSDVCAVPAAGIVAEAMVALVLADAVAEKFGGDSVPETRRNVQSLPRQPADPVSAGPLVVLVGPMGVGQVHRRASCSPSGSASPTGTPTPTSSRPQGREISDIFVDEGEPHFRDAGAEAVAAAVAEHAGVLALGGGAILDDGTRELLAGLPVVYLSMDVEEAVTARRPRRRAPAARRQPAPPVARADGRPPPPVHRGRPRRRRHRRPHPRRGRPSGPRRTGAEGRMTQTRQ